MFKSRSPIARLLLNSVFAFALFWIFRSIGWIQITDAMPLWAVALLVTLASVVVGWLMGFVFILLSPVVLLVGCLTLGLGFLVIGPVFQYFGLLLISKVTMLFTLTTVWWQALILGAAFGWFRFTAPSTSSSSTVSFSSD